MALDDNPCQVTGDVEPASRGTGKALVAVTLMIMCVAIGIGIGIGIGAGIWKDGSSSTTSAQGDLEALFRRVDGNQDGSISVDELTADVAGIKNVTLNDAEVEKVLSLLDSDDDGVVSREEFLEGADQTVEGDFWDGMLNVLNGYDLTNGTAWEEEWKEQPDFKPEGLTAI